MKTTLALFLLAIGLLIASTWPLPKAVRTEAYRPSTASCSDHDALVEWTNHGPRCRKAIEEPNRLAGAYCTQPPAEPDYAARICSRDFGDGVPVDTEWLFRWGSTPRIVMRDGKYMCVMSDGSSCEDR